MNLVIIGSGGREHAIASKLAQSPKADNIFLIPGNGGTYQHNVNINPNDFNAIKDFCHNSKVELIIVGPENPLANGIVDFFSDSSIKVFGPDKKAARLESSKIFAKKFMQKYHVPTAAFEKFMFVGKAGEYLKTLSTGCVIKLDGLAAGKGVYVSHSQQEAIDALSDFSRNFGDNSPLLIEEILKGHELSIMAFTDGKDYQILLPSQDHKQLLDGDNGPNTGGMGAFCPVDFCTPELLEEIENKIIKPTINGLTQEKFNYHGVLYFGLMLTDSGPKVLEFNVRLGDPETEVVLPSLKNDLLSLILACYDGSLPELKLEFDETYFVDVVLASGGYPGEYKKGFKINGIKENSDLIFHAGTIKDRGSYYTSGGRVLNIIGKGITLDLAIIDAYEKVKNISFDKMFFRKDIGKRYL